MRRTSPIICMYMRFRPRRVLFYTFCSTILIVMWAKLGLLFSSALPLLVTAQSGSVILRPGTAVEGDYSGIWRPQIHFSPPRGFMNDPNGMFLDGTGVYHLYYQYNPTQTIAGKFRPGGWRRSKTSAIAPTHSSNVARLSSSPDLLTVTFPPFDFDSQYI